MSGYAIRLKHWRQYLPIGWQSDLSPQEADEMFRGVMAGRGVAVRSPSHPEGYLGVSASDDQLKVEFGVDGVHVWSRGEDAFVLIRRTLPESVGLAIVGLSIGDVVEHPALSGRAYPITECTIAEPSDDTGGGTTIRFHTGRLPFAMPFQGIVAKLVEGIADRREPRRA